MHAKRAMMLPTYLVSYLPKVSTPQASLAASVRSLYSQTYFDNFAGTADMFHSQASYDSRGSRHNSGYYGRRPGRFQTQPEDAYRTPGESPDPENLYIRGFLQVFDALCDKGMLEAAQVVLLLLDKEGVDIYSHRFVRYWNLLDEEEARQAAERHAIFIASMASLEGLDKFCEEGKVEEAVEVLPLLVDKHIAVDLPRYVRLMKLCRDSEALEEAKVVHEHVTRAVSPVDVCTYNQILEMYVGCGSMENAYAVFEDMAEHNLTTWDIMIRSLAENGLGQEAVDLYYQFKQAGLRPDEQLFISFLHACAAICDVHEGMHQFEVMRKDFGIAPTMKHYKGIVEMLGRAGHLDEALGFIESMPLEPGVDIWEALMNLCRIHGYMELGQQCADIIEQMDSSWLSEHSRQGLVQANPSDIAKEEERRKLTKRHMLKEKKPEEFRMGDTTHPESPRIYALLRGLSESMKEAGHIPNTRSVLFEIDQESKEDFVLAHSSMLAISKALMSTMPRAPLRVLLNMRTSVDCHNKVKIMSKLVGREFILGEKKRFHHISYGVCSCRDYW